MTELLEKAFRLASKLPQDLQDQLAVVALAVVNNVLNRLIAGQIT